MSSCATIIIPESSELAKQLAALLDCKPDEVLEHVQAQLGFMDHTTAVQSQLEFDAESLESDRVLLQNARQIASDALVQIDANEMTPQKMMLITLQALSAIAAGKQKNA